MGLLRQVGPALVLATVVVGPGSLTLHTIAGGQYGYQLLWVPVIGTVLMMAYTIAAARIALATGRTLFDLTGQHYGSSLAKVGSVSAFLAVLAFQAGNSAAVGFASAALAGGDFRIWALVWTLLAMMLMRLPTLYRSIEWFVKIIVGLMLLTFAGTLTQIGVDLPTAASGLVPQVPDTGAALLAVGMAGTTFSIVAAVYQGYLMKEKSWGVSEMSVQRLDSFLGIGLLGVISITVLMTSAGVIYGAGREVESAADMARQLEPLIGPSAFYLFTIGFFFASFSSLVVNPLIGAAILADGLQQSSTMDGPVVRWYSLIAMNVGLLVVLGFGGTPTELIRVAQGLAVVAFPVLGFLIIALGRRSDVMGEHASSRPMQGILLVGYAVLLVIVGNYLRLISGWS